MKNTFNLFEMKLIILLVFTFIGLYNVNAQNPISTSGGASQVFFQNTNTTQSNLYLGFQYHNPGARFHIVGDPSTIPVLTVVG